MTLCSYAHGQTFTVTMSVSRNDTGAERSGTVRFANTAGSGHGDSFTLKQPRVNQAPQVTAAITGGDTGLNGFEGTVVQGVVLRLAATASDPDVGDTLHYAWETIPSGRGTISPTDSRTATWTLPGSHTGVHSAKVTVTDDIGATADATVTVAVIERPVCRAMSRFKGPDDREYPGRGRDRGTAASISSEPHLRTENGLVSGTLMWQLDRTGTNHEYCPPESAWSRSHFRASAWSPPSSGSGNNRISTLGPVELSGSWNEIEFLANGANNLTEDQYATIQMDTTGTPFTFQLIHLRRLAPEPVTTPACGRMTLRPDGGKSQTYSVGGYYRGEGMTQRWTHLSFGPDGGGCSADGIRLNSARAVHVCGYNGSAPTASDPSGGASVCTGSGNSPIGAVNRGDVRRVTSGATTVAEWVAVRVLSPPETCADPELKVRNDGDDWVHLHFGCTFAAAIGSGASAWYRGDTDYSRWSLSNEALTWEYDADDSGSTPTWVAVPSGTETPNATKSVDYPGSWSLACGSTGRTHGWRVGATATYSGAAETSTASAIVCSS